MSTAARPAAIIREGAAAASKPWTPWAIYGADVVALEVSFALAYAVRIALGSLLPVEIGVDQFLGVGIGVLLLPVIFYQIGLYPGYLLGPVEKLRRRLLATVAVFGGLVAWDNIVARGVFSRGILLATFAFALMLPPLAEALMRKILIRRGAWGMPVLMLGAGESAAAVARTLAREPDLGLRPVAFLDNHPALWNETVENVPVAGPLALARDYEDRVEAAIVFTADLGKQDIAAILQDLNIARLIVIPDLAGIASLWVTARDLSGSLGGGCLGFEIKKNLLIRRNRSLKVAMDWAVAVPLFLLSLPALGAAALWIKLTSRGPAFHRQIREGFAGRPIDVWKLRTMHVDGGRLLEEWFEAHPEDRDHWRSHFKLREDPRVLPFIGRVLRRTSLDELPQLWSVLKGEMSLVGPRPLPDYHLEQIAPEFRELRARVLPGLTGLWQVSGRGDNDLRIQESLDAYYIRNWSPWLDLYILARTVAAVLLARGAY